jgi:hypothetical protein
MAGLDFSDQTPQQNAKTVEQMVGVLLIQGAGHLEMLRRAKAAYEAGDDARLRSVFSMVDSPGSESGGGFANLRMLVYECLDRSGGEPTSYG